MNTIEKKFVNDVKNCVKESLQGLVKLYPGLYFHDQHSFVTKSQIKVSSKVAVISGGGSGHEPFCAGYVGDGMLAGAIAGNVFTSPPKSHVLQAIHYLNQYYKGGILVIIPNYTGDCLNFGMAIESAKIDNINIEAIIVGEDCASGGKSKAGRRGMCGLVYIYKMAGALADMGESINSIYNEINNVLLNMSTLGITSKACSLPGQAPLFTISDDEMELGTGVHGEAGIEKIKFTTAKDAVKIILEQLCNNLNIIDKDSVIIMINNLGTTTEIELNILCYEVSTQLESKNISIERLYCGNLMTSLNMTGFQISILKLPIDKKSTWIELLDKTTEAPRWVGSKMSIKKEIIIEKSYYDTRDKAIASKYQLSDTQKKLLKLCLKSLSQSIIKYEEKLNYLDSGCGDGDCGSTLVRFSRAIESSLTSDVFNNPITTLNALSKIAETDMGGTSGAIYSIFFSSMNNHIIDSNEKPLPLMWAEALKAGINMIKKYGRVTIGDRTIIDALEPAVNKYCEIIESDINKVKIAIKEALKASKMGCDNTKFLEAKAGRASYVNQDRLKDVDAGAYGVVICLEAIENVFCNLKCMC